MKNFSLFLVLLLLFSCTDPAKSSGTTKKITKANTQNLSDLDTSVAGSKKNLINFEKGKVETQKKLKSGIVLKWIERRRTWFQSG